MIAFAESPTGSLYRVSCERYGIDPARFLDDDVAAFNFRLALHAAALEKDEAPMALPGAVTSAEQARAAWNG